ncbi:MAG: SRPBCC family protein [Steroidobacteraceae bacterium]|nr:SRPBCC family protein [Steroidobacteraceae bacterium]
MRQTDENLASHEQYAHYDSDRETDAATGGGGFLLGAVTGAALASALVYLLDPDSGTSRRAQVRARASSAYARSRQGISSASQTVGTRARDWAAQGRQRIDSLRSRGDSTRGKAGSTGAPGSTGTLGDAGPSSGGMGSGQQAQTRMQGLAGLGFENAERIATGAAGLGLAGLGLARRGPLGLALGALGLYILAQTARQKRGAHLESGIEIDETITIDAPLTEVWQFVRRIETWPQFMSHVQEITPTGERRHRWRVDGPAGIPAEWESEITSEIPNESLSWRTIAGSPVDTEGTLLLENDGVGGTRLTVRMLYHPPAGALGDVVAKLFRRDPKSTMPEDLRNLKRMIEGGGTPGGASTSSSATTGAATGLRGASTH